MCIFFTAHLSQYIHEYTVTSSTNITSGANTQVCFSCLGESKRNKPTTWFHMYIITTNCNTRNVQWYNVFDIITYVQNCRDNGMASQFQTAHMNWWFCQINNYEVPWLHSFKLLTWTDDSVKLIIMKFRGITQNRVASAWLWTTANYKQRYSWNNDLVNVFRLMAHNERTDTRSKILLHVRLK